MAAFPHSPNQTFRRLRGRHSPAEFAAMVRRAAKEIGETVSCDARYIGRVESGEIRCPNYAYERVFLHMFPGRTLADLGFSPREAVRGRSAQRTAPFTLKESDVLRRAFMAGGSATVAAATIGLTLLGDTRRPPSRAGESEAAAVEEAVRQIRLLDDRHGADALYRKAAEPLRTAYALLDAGATRQSTEDRLHAGAGELAVSVGWLAHDSGRFDDARSHYAEALATARVSGDAALEAHAFSNMAFLARDCGRPRESVRAAQAGRRGGAPPPRATPARPARPATARVAAVCCASVTRPASVVHTRTAGTDGEDSNALRASSTRVDSALRGRKAAWSLVATSPSLPAYGPRVPPIPSQTSSSATGTIQKAQRGVLFMQRDPQEQN
ncbi:hypothetical protein ACFXA3_30890 [Streptomyces sp. NPDC059456]|uniref:hypothetical protein n=1 Tax=Streptomyces sp. NPDC059456 TaxID=3346838 RepID=UPI0036B4C32D